MRMTLENVDIENFKGIVKMHIDFKDGINKICGANATYKTSVFDAICWVLFGKDSYDREKFNIRRLDENGEKIHDVEIMASATFSADDKKITFTKKQKENWVKKRGSDNPVLQGNVNSCEINGFPKTDSEYKEEVANIVDEDIFKMLTNPAYFPSLAWKEQRQILMRFVGENADVEIAKELGGYDEILSDLEYAKDTDEIQKKYSKQIKELKSRASEIPVRIDEIQKSRVEIDIDACTSKKNALEGQIAELDKQIASGSVDTLDIQLEINDLKQKIQEVEWNLTQEYKRNKAELDEELSRWNAKKVSEEQEKRVCKSFIELNDKTFQDNEQELESLKQKYLKAKEMEFDVSEGKCKYCGQDLPTDQLEKVKADFEKRKQAEIKKYNNEGKRLKKINEDLGKEIKAKAIEIDEHNQEIETISIEIEKTTAQIDKLKEPDIDGNEEIKAYGEQIDELQIKVLKAESEATDTSELESKRRVLKTELSEIEAEIGKASKNKDIDNRVNELQEEMKDVQQKIADAEKLSFLLESFVKAKMDKVSKAINDKFELCNFKLFEQQINGGIKECCELTVNGVPYSTLNSGHRIVAGLDVIKSLQGLLGRNVPIWIDNAESVNDYNLPQLDGQMILLTVTDDKKLEVR